LAELLPVVVVVVDGVRVKQQQLLLLGATELRQRR
jgi:hypothetical protein